MKTNLIEILGNITLIYPTNYDKPIIIDTEDYEKVKNYCWSVKKDSDIHIYARARERGTKKFVLMHRIIFENLENKIVDHINHNTLDNRKDNLNVTDRSGNNKNKIRYAIDNKGIFVDKRCPESPWVARVGQKQIGWYKTKNEAEKARKDYLKENKIYVKGFDYHL